MFMETLFTPPKHRLGLPIPQPINDEQATTLTEIILAHGVPYQIERCPRVVALYPLDLSTLILDRILPRMQMTDIDNIVMDLFPVCERSVVIAQYIIAYGMNNPTPELSLTILCAAITLGLRDDIPAIVLAPNFEWSWSTHVRLRNYDPTLSYQAALVITSEGASRLSSLAGIELDCMIEGAVNNHQWDILDTIIQDPRMLDPQHRADVRNWILNRGHPGVSKEATWYCFKNKLI